MDHFSPIGGKNEIETVFIFSFSNFLLRMSLMRFTDLPKADLNAIVHCGKTKQSRYFMLVNENVDATLLDTFTIIDDGGEFVSLKWEKVPGTNNSLYHSKSRYSESNVISLSKALFKTRLGEREEERLKYFIVKVGDIQTLGNINLP